LLQEVKRPEVRNDMQCTINWITIIIVFC
jgi:hypothetical protein